MNQKEYLNIPGKSNFHFKRFDVSNQFVEVEISLLRCGTDNVLFFYGKVNIVLNAEAHKKVVPTRMKLPNRPF